MEWLISLLGISVPYQFVQVNLRWLPAVVATSLPNLSCKAHRQGVSSCGTEKLDEVPYSKQPGKVRHLQRIPIETEAETIQKRAMSCPESALICGVLKLSSMTPCFSLTCHLWFPSAWLKTPGLLHY